MPVISKRMRAFLQHPLALLMALALATAVVVVAPVTGQAWLTAAQAQETENESVEGGVEVTEEDLTLTVRVSPTPPAALQPGGGEARVDYTVKNNSKDDTVYRFESTSNDLCGSNVARQDTGTGRYLYPGQSMSFSCETSNVTFSKLVKVNAKFTKLDDQLEPTVVELNGEQRILVKENQAVEENNKCNRQYFSTFMNGDYQFLNGALNSQNPYAPHNVIGFINPLANGKTDGRNSIPGDQTWRIPTVLNLDGTIAYESGAAALAIDPRNPDVAYAALRYYAPKKIAISTAGF